MNNMLRVVVVASFVFVLAACGQKAAQTVADVASSVPTVPAKDDDAAWKTYLGQVVSNHLGNSTGSPFLYYLPPASDPDFKGKYDRQLENVTSALGRGVQPGTLVVFGSSASAKMADLIVAAFNKVQAGSMKGVHVLFIGMSADNARVQKVVQPSGAEYVFVEAK
ncbi:hypothetical protein LZ757_01405 [Xylella fastidiosa subsp. morus]|uniref:Uncharacterized protein n=1 Tax=Xylella fastidiosa subsp. fastidiosa TaxID=644356 RepID=A0AAJ5R1I7_XYLFS|nr:hypothetical protein [Xylella fastidiosa]AIC13141.1 hypothetical protein P303_10420 [Xylella fastidiosa MUL0034]KQH73815.1 hypothetical protein AOT81_06540 [Xylella fastidiosa]MDC7970507.1 hypothetical protein [Xylella fastidiosa subsp. multiplex]MDD0942583.1 hypothetical protein [Xylella fastidiosa subsp. multiplex]QTX30232.1 hypothetical protein KBP48_01395 [Xylella fastidiosa subsp. multiplex]